MQPYFFPYLGYYQLAQAADDFVFLDDASFIKQGYINRNTVLLNGTAHRFTLPVRDVSSFRAIHEHQYTGDWQPLLGLLASAYRRAPRRHEVLPLIEALLRDGDDNVARKNAASIRLVFDYLGLPSRWHWASDTPHTGLRGQDRVLQLCRAHGAERYVNSPGGRALYSAADFEAAGIQLRFVNSQAASYHQGVDAFVPHLSMIDLLMHCDRPQIVALLGRYTLEA